MSVFTITVTMSPQTVSALQKGGYSLYALQAVQCSDKAGLPAVAQRIQNYSRSTRVAIATQNLAYTSLQPQPAGGETIVPSFSVPIHGGQTLNIDEPKGAGTVVQGGGPHTITIANQTTQQAVCGLASASAVPQCAFPLYGNGLELIHPLAQVLLFFSSVPIQPGTLIEVSTGPGVLVDCAASATRGVTFDINQGWSWGGYGWAQNVAANSDVVPLLIQYSDELAAEKQNTEQLRTSAGA